MRHKWTKQNHEVYAGIGVFNIWLCKVCGAKKSLGTYKFATPDYERNGQLYDHYIECIDEEFEKTKTID